MALAEEYSKPTKRGEYQYVSGAMGISYNPFMDPEAGVAYMSFEVAELLKFWTERIVEIHQTEREKPRLGLLLEKIPEVISVPRSGKKVELRLGGEDNVLSTNLGTIWKLLRPSWCQPSQASQSKEVTGRANEALASEERGSGEFERDT